MADNQSLVKPGDLREVSNPPPPVKHPLGRWIIGIVVLLLAVGVFFLVQKRHADAAKTQTNASRAAQMAVPVVLGKAAKKDVPIYLDGLGTVQAYNTVTVRSRVDGQLMKIAFTEGQDVASNQVIAMIDPAPFRTMLDQSIAKKAQDQAQLTNALIELKREEALLAAKIDAQSTYDSAKALADQMDATVKADQAAIESAQVQLDYCTISSPIEGRTGIRQVDQGNVIHATDTNGLVVITQLKPISVIFTLPEQSLTAIHRETNAGDFTVLAMDRDNSTILDRGKLAVIDNQIDVTTSTIRLKANFPNPGLKLWPGQFVNVRLLLTTRKDGVVVPASVVQRGPEGALATYAFVTEGEGTNLTAKQRAITVAQIDQGEALVDSGLTAGETVVVDGQYKLQDGSHIRPSGAGRGGGSGAKSATGGASE